MRTLLSQLRSWQRREWLYRAAWGFARWAALVFVVLTVACAADWVIDRFRDVPFALRLLMTAGQLALYAAAGYWFLGRLHVPSLDALAGRAERRIPEFDHRLVTAIQLNRPGAKTQGMSPLLIREVTREAEEMSARHRLASLADPRRVKWALALLGPVVLFAGVLAALRPDLVAALLARQCLLDVEIPRSVRVVNRTAELWPAGDEVELLFEVSGPVRDDAEGVAVVRPEGQPSERFALTLKERTDENTAVFAAKLPPSSVPFTFRAWVGDGRTRGEPGQVRFEPRPVVREVNAWVLLPAYVDPEGKRRYPRFQPQGEVLAVAGSAVRVQVELTKPVARAELVLLGRDAGPEAEHRRIPMALAEGGESAVVEFDLPPRPSGYRVEVADRHGFANANPPRRGITLAPDEPPRVHLLNEVLKDPREDGPLDDFEVNGMPLALGGQVQIGYATRSPMGVARARIVYRVNDGPWTPLPLTQVRVDPDRPPGRFVPELGVFEDSGAFGQVEFYPIPADDPEAEPPGLEAGGRYNFKTADLTKTRADGQQAKLELGDRVEYYVEAFDRNPAKGRPGGRSESRIKTVVTQPQLQAWLDQRDQSRDRLRQIEERQRGVFARPKPR